MTTMKTHEFSVDDFVDGVKHCLHGAGALGGGFNLPSIGAPTEDWAINWCRTGGTGNHGIAAVVPRSDTARAVASAVAAAFFDGLVGAINAAGWKHAPRILAAVYPPPGASESSVFSLWGSGDQIAHEWSHCFAPTDDMSWSGVAYFVLRTEYAVRLPGIYDLPRYRLVYLGGGDARCLSALRAAGLLQEDEEEDEEDEEASQ